MTNLSLFDGLPVLVKEDKDLGWAYFCPACKTFVCGGPRCQCGQLLDWQARAEHYTGKVYWEMPKRRTKMTDNRIDRRKPDGGGE